MNGIINVLKPTGITSHGVVSFIRKNLNMKKVGHTGTLDPNAAGVLPICVGKATKVSQFLLDKKKRYRAELTLGKETDTQDKSGNVINEAKVNVKESDIIKAFDKFRGNIFQTPPMFSALKHKGKKLYELAREGKTIERKPRKITIYDLDILNIEGNKVLFDVECSKGTYVRTLCDDIGKELGTYGYMSVLIRTKVDMFEIDEALTFEEIKEAAESNRIDDILLPMDMALTQYDKIELNDENYKIISNGGRVSLRNTLITNNQFNLNDKFRVYCMDSFIGIGIIKDYENNYYLKMDKVLL
ncbi:tRNA pseudouridine(55) synthase TruB [Sporosalibacterium faouarense]|uniref:tRNA pseudouridine(55) synthase TruB n=1 Tax=Sporosalibacterium faouarense TaxID=516123 RepID=UPI00141CD3B3|nr:tRNA pseudouridine(55) synthase TruB [Sporosalibacterium faouarense]MTI48041.1 tRNA pseudouridine(55) synthase TruB [Bacillota bacterium]